VSTWLGQRLNAVLDAAVFYVLWQWGIPFFLALVLLSLSSTAGTFALFFFVLWALNAIKKMAVLGPVIFPGRPAPLYQ
jgi:hypothetical protein